MSSHQNLQDVTEDQLSLASIHYMRSHYQEAIDIYKRILLDNRCASLNPSGASMLLVVFKFQIVAWFLKVGVFHNCYVPFPSQNVHQVAAPQFFSFKVLLKTPRLKRSLLSLFFL